MGYHDSDGGSDSKWDSNPVKGATARFWVRWLDGWVRLTLAPGEERQARWSCDTDEGWKRGTVAWYHAGDHVSQQAESESMDCDGRMSGWAESTCPIEELSARVSRDGAIPLPKWSMGEWGQQDHAAEAAGY